MHESAGKVNVKEDRVTISSFRGHEPEKDVQGVEDGGLEMGPEGDSTEHIGVPVRNAVVKVDLVIEELLHSQVKGKKVGSKKKMTLEHDLPEHKETGNHQQGKRESVSLGEVKLWIGHRSAGILLLLRK